MVQRFLKIVIQIRIGFTIVKYYMFEFAAGLSLMDSCSVQAKKNKNVKTSLAPLFPACF